MPSKEEDAKAFIPEETMKELRNGQQKKEDSAIVEQLPEEFECPNCGSRMKRVFTKRGIHYKCSKCNYDTNRVFDFSYHEKYKYMVMEKLKEMFPKLNFVENLPIDTNILTGSRGKQRTRYDISAFWFGRKIARIRVEVNRHISYNRFFETDENYVLGNPKIVEYLKKKDALLLHYLINETDVTKQIGLSSIREILKFGQKVTDKFGNEQYHIPKEIRKVVVTFDKNKIEELLFRNFHKLLYREFVIK